MTCGCETRPLLVDVGLKFERAEMQMIRWMFGITFEDRRTNETLQVEANRIASILIQRLVGVEPITTFIRMVD